MKRLLLAIAALAALITTTSPAAAYWEYGHETVAAIAWKNISPHTRSEIRQLLAHSAVLDTPTCPTRTIEEASVWADCVKTLGPRFAYAYNWHFQNVDICKPFAIEPVCPDGNCVSAQIERQFAKLKNRRTPMQERVMALAFLVHFVGDLHQPLHAGDRGDLGGNRARTTYGSYSTERLNLHAVWDGLLAERAISTPPSLVRIYSPRERRIDQAGTVTDWSRENWQVARDVAYATAYGEPCGPVPQRAQLSEAAIEAMIAPARAQIRRGGLRLARLLDAALR